MMAGKLKEISTRLGIPLIFKASFDKANRTALESYRGPGLEKGLAILSRVRDQLHLPVLTDIHEVSQVAAAARVVDCLQIPAFLARQTDLLVAAGRSGCPVNLKKAQFLSPWDMEHAVKKVASAGCSRILVTERGTCFGYNNLVVDMRSFPIMGKWGFPVIFDATHSLQLPGGQGTSSGGQPEYIRPLAQAAVAAGVDGLFLEVHDDPPHALSDGANSLPLARLETLLASLLRIHEAVRLVR
jgi:2-dehydro-3-deoxyphosphooctonate aldolase (KDO 8-P synthase)